jgi:predicted O-linked N-acetylglucosamine transferase (SPINDLY family)
MLGWLRRWLPGRGGAAQLLMDATRSQRAGRLQDAESACRAAIAAAPGVADAHFRLGNILRDQGRLDEAMAAYARALALQPAHAMAHVTLGNLLNDLGRPGEAGEHFLAAIAAKPGFADAYANLGNSLQYMSRFDEAIACYRQAIALDPGYVEAHHNLGNALSALDLCEDASASFRAALALNPDYVESRWALTMSQLPAVCMDQGEAARRRAAFARELGEMDRWFDAARTPLGARAVGVNQPFYLAYHEENNRDLLASYGALCCRLMHDWSTRVGLRAPTRNPPGGKLRVGVVSEYFWNHSVWHAIARGWFAQIDPNRFALYAFHLGAAHDSETQFAMSRAAHFEEGGRGLQQWAQAILDQQLDVLIYPNIGNDTVALRLASLRLAPVQATSWGHPETTGLPTLDYYLSAQDMEPPDGEANYVEQLVRLPHLGCHYRPHPVAPVTVDPQSLGLDPGRPLLLCAGTPFKYAPQHDRVFTDIARRAPRCLFVFFEHDSRRYANARLKQRLDAVFAAAGLRAEEHIAFVPWLDRSRYYGLMRRADMLLDTMGFSGFNIAMQAIECGLPIVAWEGRFLRGRFASAVLLRMGLPELVARDRGEYAAIATRLLQDGAFRDRARARIAERRAALFEDQAPIRALERFLLGAAARPGASV